MSERKLVCIDIVAGRTLYSRTVYTEYEPTSEDLNFYYRNLCGFNDAIVTSTIIDVPEDFNQALVAFSEQIPTRFPNYDITATLEESDKIARYHDYIKQMSQMEAARAALKVHITTAATAPNGNDAGGGALKTPDKVVEPKRRMLRRHDWVREILQTLESEETPVCDDIVPVEQDNFIPHAWIITPVLTSVRNERGSRLLMNPVKGKYWERLLGSSLFPDFVVSSRISTHTWLFQHDTADAMLRATLNFYLASQDTKVVDGLSGFIPAAEKEFNMLMRTFKKIKVNERVMVRSEEETHIYNLLNNIEIKCLVSKAEEATVVPLNIHMFRKYVNYVAQTMNIPYETYSAEGVTQVLRRWEQSGFGFRADVDPIIPAWKTAWNLIMSVGKGSPTVEQVALFLATLDTWNPHEANVLSQDQLLTISEQWIEIFVNKETVPDSEAFEIVLVLCDEVRRWCLQYLPATLFEKILRKESHITTVFAKYSYTMTKPWTYKKMNGVRLRVPTNKTVFEGNVVDKGPNIPEPKLWKEHPQKFKAMPKPTKNGKFVGRPPKEGTPIAKARAEGILNMMNQAATMDVGAGTGAGAGADAGEIKEEPVSTRSSSIVDESSDNNNNNELVMNLGTI